MCGSAGLPQGCPAGDVGAVVSYRAVGREITGWEMACGMQAGTVRPAWVQARVRSWR